MKTTIFKSNVTKGNSKGVGFIRFPANIKEDFSFGDQYKVTINSQIIFYAKVRYNKGKGIFIPLEITIKNKLYKKIVNIKLEKINGFYAKIGSEGRVYIPNSYELKDRDIISINVIIDEKTFVKYPRIYLKERRNTKEIIFYLDSSFRNKSSIIKINGVLKKNEIIKSHEFFEELLKKIEFAEIKKGIILYYGNRVPIIINNLIDIGNLAYYLGCYFADGTKRGNDWGICASTFEQSNYYIKKHNEIIQDPNTIHSLTITTTRSEETEKLKEKLIKIWFRETGLKIEKSKIRVIKTQTEFAPNRCPYGSLPIKEHRQLTQIYYNRLLEYLFEIIKEGNKDLATDFICGTMEGDGCLNSKTHAHIIVTTNNLEINILKEICDESHLKSSIRRWKGKENRVDLLVGSLEIIKNIPILKDKLFKYYPKRRKILKERLAQTGCAKFLLGKTEKTSNWLIGQLKNYDILDGEGKLTKKGNKIQKDLKKFLLSSD